MGIRAHENITPLYTLSWKQAGYIKVKLDAILLVDYGYIRTYTFVESNFS